MSRALPRLARALPAVALAVAVLPWGIAQYRRSFATVPELATIPMSDRRALVLGDWYPAAAELRNATRPGAAIDLVVRTKDHLLYAQMLETALHLRDCRIFEGWEAWRRRERIPLHPDPRSAGFAPGPLPGPAELVIAIRPGPYGPGFQVVEPPR